MRRCVISLAVMLCFVIPIAASHPSARGYSREYPEKYSEWQNSFFAGNGRTGIILFGAPVSESVVFTSRDFNFPNEKERSFAVVPRDTVEKISLLCAQGDFEQANALAVRSAEWSDGGEGGRHPGFMMRIDVPEAGEVSDYSRSCDYSTGEISVEWSDDSGRWERRAFVSRADDVGVFHIGHDGKKFSCAVSLSLPEEAHFPEGMTSRCRVIDSGSLGIEVSYPVAMGDGGYSGVVRARTSGGHTFVKNDTLFIENTRGLTLVAVTGKGETGDVSVADYDELFIPHRKIHQEIFDRVTVDFGADDLSRNLPNEVLLKMQKESESPIPALWERVFYSGRYHFLASSSEVTPPDLLGIWTGDCNVGWGGYYHLDANLNLQVSAGNVCDMPEAMEGYFHLNEVWVPDFERNARDLLGCRGMVACGNTPGLSSGLMASISDDYPYHYATGEEPWLLYPFWEYYLTTRDEDFLRERLFPLLVKMGNFYEDFLRHKDGEGKYILAGSISPENQPSNRRVSLLNNSAFDVAGARWLLATLVKACDILGEKQGAERDVWAVLLAGLPDYRVNADGAVSEWGWPGVEDNYWHRHSSHLMGVWPYRETSHGCNPELYASSRKALEMRDRYDYQNAGHGFLHGAYIAACLGDVESFTSKMNNLLRRDFYYTGLTTAHYPDFGVFCTDVCHTVPGLMAEMVSGSDEYGIYLLPVLVKGLERGKITGLKTRCGVTVESMEWDCGTGMVKAILNSPAACRILVSAGSHVPCGMSLPAGRSAVTLPLN